jgi:hypothetical protein
MQQKSILRLAAFLLAALLLPFSCKKDEDPSDPNAQLIVSPENVMLNDNEEGKIFLSVQPKSTVSWQVAGKPDWMDVSPESGTYSGQIQELKLMPQPTGLPEGTQVGIIEIISDGAGKASVTVQLSIGAHPKAEVSPQTLNFPAGTDQQTLTVTNIGTGFLTGNLTSPASWVSFQPSSFSLSSGSSQVVLVTVNREGLAIGSLQSAAIFESNAENGPQGASITLTVPESGLITASNDSLLFNYFVDTRTTWLRNGGNTAFQWNASANQSFLQMNPSSGTLAPGDSVKLTIDALRNTFGNSSTYTAAISVQNNKGESLDIPVAVRHFKEEKWLLAGSIVDAEYDRSSDKIIAVTESPNQLLRLDPTTQTIQTVALNYVPTCVSVAPNGNFAAVGHNAAFSYVNLNTLSVQQVYAITTDALDIVLAPNNWVYVFPRQDQWENIRCVNLSTGNETLHAGNSIYAGTRAKLHPSGNYIYGANNGLSPSDFEKYNIAGGTAQYLYDSPYHGDYEFAGDLWFADDGARIFARSRNVFKSSTLQNNDMTYNGALVGEGGVVTLDHSTAANRIYSVFSDGMWFWDLKPGNQVRRYDAQFLAFQGTMTLPDFLVPDGTGGGKLAISRGYFGFFNAAGNKFHILVKAHEDAGAVNEWALVSLDVQ